MDEQERWIITHPGASKEPLVKHLEETFSEYTKPSPPGGKGKQQQQQQKKKSK